MINSDPFQLTEDAILDIDAIWLYLLAREGVETADRIVAEIFAGFYRLADNPSSGHRRADLTNKQVLLQGLLLPRHLRAWKQTPSDSRGASWKAERGTHSEGAFMRAAARYGFEVPGRADISGR
ncbi:MAG: type II toxin-antitoxin system RelE/ParE family toxin [Bryobacteraceae bacterium]